MAHKTTRMNVDTTIRELGINAIRGMYVDKRWEVTVNQGRSVTTQIGLTFDEALRACLLLITAKS